MSIFLQVHKCKVKALVGREHPRGCISDSTGLGHRGVCVSRMPETPGLSLKAAQRRCTAPAVLVNCGRGVDPLSGHSVLPAPASSSNTGGTAGCQAPLGVCRA